LRGPLPAVEMRDGRVTVAVPDRAGVLSLVAGVLAVRGLDVRRAALGGDGGVAIEVFDVASTSGIDAADLTHDVEAALAGSLDVWTALAEGARARRALTRPSAAHPAEARVLFDEDASDATVIEVRAPDGLGVLARIAGALAESQIDIRRALVSTLGQEVVDVFYVDRLPAARRPVVEAAVLAALANS
jgi:[protein-PII] uridylyltransferase